MNPWYAKAIVLLANVAMIVIRAPHGARSRTVKVIENRKGMLDGVLLAIMWVAFLLPIVWVASPWFAFAEYPLHPVPYGLGIVAYALGLWLFFRSHADLGTNWSVTLEVREEHQLVTRGVYERIRHPMYLALLLHGLGQALVVPNYIVGPSYIIGMIVLVGCRLRDEERMMVGRFGENYEVYRERTKRLIPGVW